MGAGVNNRIRDLAISAGAVDPFLLSDGCHYIVRAETKRFAELIIADCAQAEERRQIVDAFIAAKSYLAKSTEEAYIPWKDVIDGSYPHKLYKTEFLLHALNTGLSGALKAEALVKERFATDKEPLNPNYNTVSKWLRFECNIPDEELTRDHVLEYTHRWIDSVIKEFSE